MTLAAVAREAAVSQILRYELYRHESLTERIRRIAPAAARRHLDDRSHQATWQIIFYLCRCYYADYRPTITDVYLSTGISKVTAIKRLRDLDNLGIFEISPDVVDRRRKHVLASLALRRALDQFVEEYIGDLRRMVDGPRPNSPATVAPVHWPKGGEGRSGSSRRIAFLGDFSHEIRIALNSIIGFSDAIRGEILGPVTPQGYREYANDIYGAGRHLQILVSELVDMAQTALTEGAPLSYDDVDAGEVVADVVAACRDTARATGVTVVTNAPTELPPVRADGRRLSQVLQSLIGHAIRHNGAGGRITVETDVVGDVIRFRIRNAGARAQPVGAQAVTPPFVEELMRDRQMEDDQSGPTLGLALSRSIVQILGGKLRFEREPDGGANATVELPRVPPTAAERGGAAD